MRGQNGCRRAVKYRKELRSVHSFAGTPSSPSAVAFLVLGDFFDLVFFGRSTPKRTSTCARRTGCSMPTPWPSWKSLPWTRCLLPTRSPFRRGASRRRLSRCEGGGGDDGDVHSDEYNVVVGWLHARVRSQPTSQVCAICQEFSVMTFFLLRAGCFSLVPSITAVYIAVRKVVHVRR